MNASRIAFGSALKNFAAKGRAGTRRWFGADHHGQPVPQSMQAELWEGHPKGEEGWETITKVTYTISAIMLVIAFGFTPDTSIQTWANNEAKARMKLKASGKVTEFEFGKHYNTAELYNFEKLDQKGYFDPFDEGGDEDEEEEEGSEDKDD